MLLVDAPEPDDPAGSDAEADQRRVSRRARPGTFGLALRAGPGGWEVPAAVVDVSAGGLGVVLADDLSPGNAVQVELAPAAGDRVRLAAEVRWCLAAGDGTFQAGLQFRRRLTPAELAALAR